MSADPEDAVLVCALADSPLVVPGSIFTRHCSTCNRRVMIAPSGQSLLRRLPVARILCGACFIQNAKKYDALEIKLAADPQDIAIEARASVPNFWRKRN